MTAFDTMIGTLFADPNCGQDATYCPQVGPDIAVRVLRSDLRQESIFGDASAVLPAVLIELRVADVAQVKEHDNIKIGTSVWRVMSFQKDDAGTLWKLNVDPVYV